jgi:hypothetical protein
VSRWALAIALAMLVVEHTAGTFETTRDFSEAGGLMIVERAVSRDPNGSIGRCTRSRRGALAITWPSPWPTA